MTLYELLSTCQTDCKVKIIDDGREYIIYAKSVDALDETIKYKMVESWELMGRQDMAVTLETDANKIIMNGKGFTFGANNPVEMTIQYTKTTT